MSIQNSWLDYKDKKLINFLYKPFLIYGKQFLRLFLISLIVEFIFFGVLQLIIFDIGMVYSPLLNISVISFSIEFTSDFARPFFYGILIFILAIFIFRSTLISNTSGLAIENQKINMFIIIENTIKKAKEIALFSLIISTLTIFPFIIIILGFLLQYRQYYMSWAIIIFAIIIPYFLLIKISLFTAGMSKDSLHVGTALQTSWNLAGNKNWFKTAILFTIYVIISIIGPWAVTIYLQQRFDYIYIGLIMVFVRALLYPLFNTAMTLLYMNYQHNSLEESVFKDDILKQQKRTEEFINKFKKNEVKEA